MTWDEAKEKIEKKFGEGSLHEFLVYGYSWTTEEGQYGSSNTPDDLVELDKRRIFENVPMFIEAIEYKRKHQKRKEK